MNDTRRSRGPYKRWMNEDDDNVDIPRTTRWRRQKFDVGDCSEASSFEVSATDTSASVRLNTNVASNEDETRATGSSYGDQDCSVPLQYPEPEQSIEHLDFGDMSDFSDVNSPCGSGFDPLDHQEENEMANNSLNFDLLQDDPGIQNYDDLQSEDEVNENLTSSLDQPLYHNSKVTLGQCLLLLMSFILGNGLTSSAIANLLKLLAMILPVGNLLPDTKYLFDKYFNEFRQGTQLHFYCPDCYKWLGTKENVWCDVCQVSYSNQDLIKKGWFFVCIPLQRQLAELLQRPNIESKIDHRFSRIKKNETHIEDIYDGEMYKQIADGKLMNDPNALSISFNCDGVPVFKSSNFSIWPLQGILNELPIKERKENVLLLGLWFGSIKPIMSSFLLPFTEEMKELGSKGMNWIKAGSLVTSTVYACLCSADSVARCILQNIKQFNGLCGCNWCENPGEVVEKGRGHCRVYPNSQEGDKLRTHADMIQNARDAFQANDCVIGVKGPTQLSQLPYFDLVSGFVVDNLHCIDLGVARQLGHLWFDSSNHQQPWYIGNTIQAIDGRLNLVQPPSEVTRMPRSLHQRAYWKGSEWHWWLLLYAPVVLTGILPQPFYGHLLLLVEAVFLLTSSSISCQDLNKADACLSQYVYQFERLYGKQHMTYNIHQLLHLTKTVTDWGPLSCYSSYIFEGFNMILIKLFHGTQAVPRQISNSFLLYRGMLAIASSLPRETDDDQVLTYVDEVLSGCPTLKKSLKVDDDVRLLGAHYVRTLTLEEKFLVEEYFRADIENEASIFHKAVVKGNVLHSVNYPRSVRRNNFTVGLEDGSIVTIIDFVVVKFLSGQKVTVAFARNIVVGSHWLRRDSECGHCCTHIKIVTGHEENSKMIELCQIEHKYAVINNGHELPGAMCCRLPNLIDRD